MRSKAVNAGLENEGPFCTGWKMQDRKMADQSGQLNCAIEALSCGVFQQMCNTKALCLIVDTTYFTNDDTNEPS